MNSKFLDWYTQALGSTFGLIACIFAYLNGYMFVYGNIQNNIDYLSLSVVLSSYLLLPLCIFTLLLSLLKSLCKEGFNLKNINLKHFNMCLVFATIIVGFIGAKSYFIIPAIFMLLNQFNIFNKYSDENNEKLNLTKIEMAKGLLAKNADYKFIIDITGLTKEEIDNLKKQKQY